MLGSTLNSGITVRIFPTFYGEYESFGDLYIKIDEVRVARVFYSDGDKEYNAYIGRDNNAELEDFTIDMQYKNYKNQKIEIIDLELTIETIPPVYTC